MNDGSRPAESARRDNPSLTGLAPVLPEAGLACLAADVADHMAALKVFGAVLRTEPRA